MQIAIGSTIGGGSFLEQILTVLDLPGTAGNYASTPDSVATSITGDIDLRLKVALDDYSPVAAQILLAKYATANAYQLQLQTTGTLRLLLNGAAAGVSTVAIPTANGATVWLRATWRQSDGRVQFFTGADGSTWTQLGADSSAVVASINDTADATEIGAWNSGANNPTAGRFFRVQILNGIDGTAAFDVDFTNKTVGATSVTEGANGATVTIHQGGAPPVAEIVAQ